MPRRFSAAVGNASYERLRTSAQQRRLALQNRPSTRSRGGLSPRPEQPHHLLPWTSAPLSTDLERHESRPTLRAPAAVFRRRLDEDRPLGNLSTSTSSTQALNHACRARSGIPISTCTRSPRQGRSGIVVLVADATTGGFPAMVRVQIARPAPTTWVSQFGYPMSR